MDRVLDRLWIGDLRDLEERMPLRTLGFSGVVDLRNGGASRDLGVPTFRLANRDGDPWTEAEIEEAFIFLGDTIRSGRVLVACAAGMSRSAALVIGYLVRIGFDPPSAYDHVRKARPKIAPLASMIEAVLRAAPRREGQATYEPETLPDPDGPPRAAADVTAAIVSNVGTRRPFIEYLNKRKGEEF